MNEANTCRKCVPPKLYAAARTDEQIDEQRNFTDGRICEDPEFDHIIARKALTQAVARNITDLMKKTHQFPERLCSAWTRNMPKSELRSKNKPHCAPGAA
jgi:type I site-specific restriction endonuclease